MRTDIGMYLAKRGERCTLMNLWSRDGSKAARELRERHARSMDDVATRLGLLRSSVRPYRPGGREDSVLRPDRSPSEGFVSQLAEFGHYTHHHAPGDFGYTSWDFWCGTGIRFGARYKTPASWLHSERYRRMQFPIGERQSWKIRTRPMDADSPFAASFRRR